MISTTLIMSISHERVVETFKEAVWLPTVGDEVATVGLYTSHHGHTKNIPVVRVGHISMLPDEPVMSTRGYVEAYLVEVRSIVGLSGSPVYIARSRRYE